MHTMMAPDENDNNNNTSAEAYAAALDAECKKRAAQLLPTMFDYVDKYAKEKPNAVAIIEYNTGEKVTWADFAKKSKAFAAKLYSVGITKGDVVATTLPLLKEHIFLMYACFRIGAIFAPLDLRLKSHEIDQCFSRMHPKAYFFLGKTPVVDFRDIVKPVMDKYRDEVKFWIQFQKEPDLIMEGATGITEFVKDIKSVFISNYFKEWFGYGVQSVSKAISKRDPCLIIFTTGSTGAPKPALLCHENVLLQNVGLEVSFGLVKDDVMLVNLPPSHVGCVTEQLATTLYGGGTAVILHIFKPDESLDAIQKYKCTVLGQIPALFNLQWRLPNYKDYDLSSLRFALYGGQAVTRSFLEQLSTMAPKFGTGLGLTETAGFVTYSRLDGTVDDIAASAGFHMPSLCPLTVREPMREDGSAGAEKPPGEIGEICFSGQQIFLGYLGDEAATRKTISTDGILYTGDLGTYDPKIGLKLCGRSKHVIKPKGYQVYPPEIEDFIGSRLKDKIANIAIVGAPHNIFTEGVMCFVEKKKDLPEGESEVTPSDIAKIASQLSAYSRPSHIEILESGDFPLNRVAKTDYVVLKERALKIVERLRAEGKWDNDPRAVVSAQ